MKRYRVIEDEATWGFEPIDPKATEQLIKEIRTIVPKQSAEQVFWFLVNYAMLANRNLSHPSDYPEYQAAFNFMVYLTNLLSKRQDGKALWHRWNLGAKGQIEVAR